MNPEIHDEHDYQQSEDCFSRRVVRVTDDIACVVDQAEAALIEARLDIFQRAGQIVRVTRLQTSSPAGGVTRARDAVVIREAPAVLIREEFRRAADWVQSTGKGSARACLPPEWVATTFVARQNWNLPVLTGITHVPALRLDGSLQSGTGFDPATGLFFDDAGVEFPELPVDPDDGEVRAALGVLAEPFGEFPFATEMDRAGAIAATLTLGCRHLIPGPVPLFAVRAPLPGSGKTLLVDAITALWTGRGAARLFQVDDAAEDRKRILAICLAADPAVLLDNLDRPLASNILAAAFTSQEVRDRVLGTSRMVSAPFSAVWFATGNGLEVGGDLIRRVVPIDLQPDDPHPEDRVGYRHRDLLQWVLEHRGRLVCSAQTLLRAILRNLPRRELSLPPFASFDGWSNLIREGLVWLGLQDPCGTCARLRKTSVQELQDPRAAALAAWKLALGTDRAWAVKEIVSWIGQRLGTCDAEKAVRLRDSLAKIYPRNQAGRLEPKRLGQALRQLAGRSFGGLVVRAGPKSEDGILWQLDVPRHQPDELEEGFLPFAAARGADEADKADDPGTGEQRSGEGILK